MTEGDVVLTPLPQADGTTKVRPAIVLRHMRPYGDLLVCGISTRLGQRVPGFDEILAPGDTDFILSGLVSTSLIRLGFLTVLPQNSIVGTIGAVSPERRQRLLKALSDYLVA